MGNKIDRKYYWTVKWMNKTCRSWEAPDFSVSEILDTCLVADHHLGSQQFRGYWVYKCHTVMWLPSDTDYFIKLCCLEAKLFFATRLRKLLSPAGSFCLCSRHFVLDAWAAFHYVSSHICIAWHLYASDHTNQKSVVSLLTAWHCSIAAATKKWHAVETAMLQAMVSIFCYMQARWHRKAKTTLLPVFFLTQSWHDVLSRWTHIELWRLRSQSDSAQVQYVCVFLELDMNWKSGDLSRSHIIKIDFYPSLESPNCRPMQC